MSLVSRRRREAFTIVEVMAVVIIVAILAAVAVPLYIAHTRRALTSEAVAGLGAVRSGEQLYYSEHSVYLAVSAGNVGNDPSGTPPGLGLKLDDNTYFDDQAFSVTLDATYNFIATADGSASTGPRASDVASFKVQMRGDGLTRYDFGSGYQSWK